MEENELTKKIIGVGIEVHRILGPGLLESIYEDSMAVEFKLQKIAFEQQKPVRLVYKDHRLSSDFETRFPG